MAVKDTERVHTAAHGRKGETVAVVDCMNASGSNSVPLVALVQKSIVRRCSSWGRYRKYDSEELPNKACITRESSANFCVISIIIYFPDSSLNFRWALSSFRPLFLLKLKTKHPLTLPPTHCSHGLLPGDKSFLPHSWKILTIAGRRLGIHSYYLKFWWKLPPPRVTVAEFKSVWIYPLNPEVHQKSFRAYLSLSFFLRVSVTMQCQPRPRNAIRKQHFKNGLRLLEKLWSLVRRQSVLLSKAGPQVSSSSVPQSNSTLVTKDILRVTQGKEESRQWND